MLEQLRARRAAIKAELEALLTTAAAESRDLSDTEDADFKAKAERMRELDARIEEVQALELSEARSAAHHVETASPAPAASAPAGVTAESRASSSTVTTDRPVYDMRSASGPSWFKDVYEARERGSREAYDRLAREHVRSAGPEARALSTAAGAGGEFAPPAWLVSEFVALARPGRVAADLLHHEQLPSGVSTINLPKVSSGTAVAVQGLQNSTVQQTDLTTSSLSAGITTIAGKQVVSLQLLEQSAIPFDRVILEDLALAYAGFLDKQVLTGTGSSGQLRGISAAAGLSTQTYTQASPTVSGAGQFYSQVAQAIATSSAVRFVSPDTILMHPRRWAWVTASYDSQGRPLVVPQSVAVNSVANDGQTPQGRVGTFQGLEVYVDPNLATNVGAGSNQDAVYVFRRDDLWLYESGLSVETFTQPYAESLGVLYRIYGYASLIPDRYGAAIVAINGTGLVTPTF